MKVYASAPTVAAPRMAIALPFVGSLSPHVARRARCEMVQKRNRMVKALARAEMVLTARATYSVDGAKSDATRPIIMKRGAPGGCPT